jgi:hypothetical protein
MITYIRGMNRRTALLAPLALVLLGTPALAEKLSLGTLSKYLNGLTTVESDFTQVNSGRYGLDRARSSSSGRVGCGSNMRRPTRRWCWPAASRSPSSTASRTSRPNNTRCAARR